MPTNPLRHLPSVHELLERPPLRKLVDSISHNFVVNEVRSFLDNLRSDLQQRAAEIKLPSVSELAERIADWIDHREQPRLRPVINATGILLHTGLGRAPLAESALQEIAAIAQGYASVEVDLESGERSQRNQAVERLLTEATGAETALVVNNNAGATLLALAAVAAGREAIVARGQLIEIGGSFRLPEVMAASGARLREVGTTNKTRISDYEAAINEQTAALMRVHTSNYIIAGFTESTPLEQLVALGRRHSLPVIDDIGSGALIDFNPYGVTGEPIARESVRAGADLVLFSGDKLLGGPQCGVIVGRRELVGKLARHPLARALRVDKVTLAALAATLRLYRKREVAEQSIPLLELLSTSTQNLKQRAERLAPQLADCPAILSAEAVESTTYLGGGSVPTQQLPTWCIALVPQGMSLDQLARRLRCGAPSVFGRIQNERLLLDLRTVFPRQDIQLVEAVRQLTPTEPTTAEPQKPDS